MNKKYQIAILGPIPRDHITTYKGKVIEKYGCITHPVIVLSHLFGDEAHIIPVSHIREVDVILHVIRDFHEVSENMDELFELLDQYSKLTDSFERVLNMDEVEKTD